MHWIMFAFGAAMSWGLYGPMMHQGQVKLGSPFRALLCVGAAYFVIGVIVPVIALASQGQLTVKGFNMDGLSAHLNELGFRTLLERFRTSQVPIGGANVGGEVVNEGSSDNGGDLFGTRRPTLHAPTASIAPQNEPARTTFSRYFKPHLTAP